MDACTIVTRRELARARVLVSSFHEHHPDAAFVVLVLDSASEAAEVAGARVVTLEQVAGPGGELLLAGNPPEALEAAVLPHLLRALQGEGAEPVLYLSPGLRVLDRLDALEAMLGEHELVVVSRALAMRLDENGDEPAFGPWRGGGAISHRVLGSAAGEAIEQTFATWPSYFEDGQKAVYEWFDGLPAIAAELGILRDVGYITDPWTVSAARADADIEALGIGGQRVHIFDFSSLDPRAPERIGGERPDARLGAIPALAGLRTRHAEELLAAGYADDSKRHWRFGTLPDGAQMTLPMRRLLLEGIAEGELTRSPFTERGRNEFYAYLNAPAERGAVFGLTRLHAEIWRIRTDVQAAYPHIEGPDGPRFAEWLVDHACEDHGLVDALLPMRPAGGAAPAGSLARGRGGRGGREPLWGVNVAGFFTSELGLGEAARLLIAGLDAGAVPALPVQAQLVPPCRQGAEFTYSPPADAPYEISILCINGDLIPPFAREVGPAFFADRHTIALWWWEVGEFPAEWAAAFEYVDEVWVGSRHIYDAVAPSAPVPVVKMTMPVVLPRVPDRTRAELGLPQDGFLFLYVHDYHSTAARKNPLGLVEAFKRAFPPASGAKLLLKSINAENVLHEHDRVVMAARDHPDISLIDAYVSAGEKNAMIAACDCYVSLHRSEGFGLTAAEAMLLGKPVIATRYGGNLEFMTAENSYLVDWKPAPVGENAHPYPAHAQWADPDLDHAARLMREVFDDPAAARARAEQGRDDVLERHAPRVAGEQMRARLQISFERLAAHGDEATPAALPQLSSKRELAQLLAARPAGAGTGARGIIKRAALAVLLRLMRPFLSRQKALDEQLAESIAYLDESLRELSGVVQSRHAEMLASSRRLTSGLRDATVAVQSLERAEAGERLRGLESRLAPLEALADELEHHLAQHRATPFVSAERAFESWSAASAGPVVGYRSSLPSDAEHRYIDFEATFRGPEDRVREIQHSYVALLTGHAPVLDIGCGRGELLDLLRDAGISASGVDVDEGMVGHARAKGHEVSLGDGVEHLRGLGERSLGAVTAIEVIEHLGYDRLVELLELSRSRLRAGGVLIVESVNPHAIDAMKAFWVDPTHQHPVFPETALELCRLAGFAEAFWFHPGGGEDFEATRSQHPIYAVLATASIGGRSDAQRTERPREGADDVRPRADEGRAADARG